MRRRLSTLHLPPGGLAPLLFLIGLQGVWYLRDRLVSWFGEP